MAYVKRGVRKFRKYNGAGKELSGNDWRRLIEKEKKARIGTQDENKKKLSCRWDSMDAKNYHCCSCCPYRCFLLLGVRGATENGSREEYTNNYYIMCT